MDNSARREVLDQTSESMVELGNMLTDMRHATDKLRQIFWEQEKKIEYLRRDLDQCDETRRMKEKSRIDMQQERSALEKTL
jgi:predicted RNase H-like nuclease (RuvC/YqgF family)